MSILLSNLVVRPPTLEDCSAIAELVEACDSAEHGIAESSMRDLASRWRIDTLLLRRAEQHAHELIHDARPDARVSLRGEASATNA